MGATLDRLRAEIAAAIEAKELVVELDMRDATYLDSQGLGVIVSSERKVHQADGYLVVSGLSNDLFELFELTKLSSIIFVRRLGDPNEDTKPDLRLVK
jgi:anti-anti-sigma factor